MERLTKVDSAGQNDLIRCFDCGPEKAGEHLENCGYCEEGWRRALDKLAAYEDTGLSPEQVKASLEDMRGICYLCANAKTYINSMKTCDHLKERGILASNKWVGCEHFVWRGMNDG